MKHTAWMLRQGGDAFGVMHHFYVMDDEDLSSEAEVAAFLISTRSKDQDLAKYVIDAWVAMLIENEVTYDGEEAEIEDVIKSAVNNLPYTFQYPLSVDEIINIHRENNQYDDVESLYDFVDDVRDERSNLSKRIKDSLNQQFCRSRFGGQYNTSRGNRELWFRISSTGYNWVNDIYIWTADHYKGLGVQTITICRDYESDYGDEEGHSEYFYTARDGSVYRNMPIMEFLAEEHDTRPIFDSNELGYDPNYYDLARDGYTREECDTILGSGLLDLEASTETMVIREREVRCVSEVRANLIQQYPTRTQIRLNNMCNQIKQQFPELNSVDIIEINPRENRSGKMVASEVIFYCTSDIEELDGLKVSIVLNRGIKDTTVGDVVRHFRIEYNDYKKFKGVEV
jgi:hypothetical protein|nr:MAG TPA: hypothetical protein [Caudoviricetes sp.]